MKLFDKFIDKYKKAFGIKAENTPETDFKVNENNILDDAENGDDKVLSLLPTDDVNYKTERFFPEPDKGLTDAQVNKRVTEKLINKCKDKSSKSYLAIVCSNLFTFFNLLCVLVTLMLVFAEAKLTNFFYVIIFAANAAIGIFQEIRAKHSISKLTLLTSNSAKVIRNGIAVDVPLDQIVLDDVVELTLGDQIPSDCVLIENGVEVNESALTGESVAVRKKVGDMLYAGSFISGGTARARITRVGNDSYIQKLTAKAKRFKRPESTLLRSLRVILSVISALIIPITALMFWNNYNAIHEVKEAIIRTSTVTIGLIPSGMFLLSTMAMAVGVIRLAQNKTLVKDLYSLEMLARIDVLCLDKTGTITDGRMTVRETIPYSAPVENENEILSSLLAATNDNNQTAVALAAVYGRVQHYRPTAVIPFSSKRKYSAASFDGVGTYVLGAPEFIIAKLPENLSATIDEQAKNGRRVLLLAYSSAMIADEKLPQKVKPLSLIVLEDNIREDAIPTIEWFKENDVAIKIISGDNPATVSEIARRVGVKNAEKYVNLEGYTTQEIIAVANEYTVFGRVTPEQKAVLVKAMKAHGHTVGMVGDGVNDILAMKEADCSITVAMGSQAAKNVANITLADNNFCHMSTIVYEGRRVVNNVEMSSSLYLMKTIFTAVFALISIIFSQPYPFELRMMIMLEVFVIGLPSFFLSMQANSERIRGNFLKVVFLNAVPGAVILILNVNILNFLTSYDSFISGSLEYREQISKTLMVIALTTGGMAYLYMLCKPLNVYRGIMFGVSAFIVALWLLWFKQTAAFGLASLTPFADYWQYIVLLLCIFLLDFPILKLLMKLPEKVKSASDKKNAAKKETND